MLVYQRVSCFSWNFVRLILAKCQFSDWENSLMMRSHGSHSWSLSQSLSSIKPYNNVTIMWYMLSYNNNHYLSLSIIYHCEFPIIFNSHSNVIAMFFFIFPLFIVIFVSFLFHRPRLEHHLARLAGFAAEGAGNSSRICAPSVPKRTRDILW